MERHGLQESIVEMKGSYRYTDVLAAAWVHIRPRRSYALLGVALLAACAWAIWESFLHGSGPSRQSGWLLLVALATLMAYAFAFVPYKVRREFRQAAHASAEVEMQADDDGLSFRFHHGHVAMAWSDYRMWKEGRSVFLLYSTDSAYLTLPKRFFGTESDMDRFRSVLVERVGTKAKARG